MCLAVPGRVVEWLEGEPPFRQATIEFGATRRAVSMECVPEAEAGDYVLVHAGIAISRIDAEEARRVLELLEQLELAEFPELPEPGTAGSMVIEADDPS